MIYQTSLSRKLLVVHHGDKGPVVRVFVDGVEVAFIDLNTRETLRLISNLTDKLIETV
jgi:hypothetical protein